MKKIHARDCRIRKISKKEEKEFLDAYHIQGHSSSTICYGLFTKNLNLVQLMSFGKPRFNKNYQWEIIRECTKKNYIVRGGTSKLWKHFLKNNSCHSCICYSYPHDNKFTNHYIDYCGFKNIKKCSPAKKIYFEGEWKGELKRIDKSILERHGVDRLLKTKQGQDRTNEQILLDLGFTKKEEDGYSPQIDIYYPFSVVYRVDDLTDGSFYIGMCEVKERWINGYLGSGSRWINHVNKYRAHKYDRTILKSNFKIPYDTRKYELNKIKQYFNDDKCLNTAVRTQNTSYISPTCDECGGKNGSHRKGCSKYVNPDKCIICGAINGRHTSTCPFYNKELTCSECGGVGGYHKKGCSYYKEHKCPECGGKKGKHYKNCSFAEPCPECGCVNGHTENCSHNKIEACPYCGRKTGPHKKSCPLFEYSYTCPECGTHNNGAHKKSCSKYKKYKGECPYCGTPAGGIHKKDCPNRPKDKKCPECGYILSSNKHAKTCSHYKPTKPQKVCPECGGVGVHKGNCSKAVKCKECGGTCGHHRKNCSSYSYKGNYKKIYCETNDTLYDSAYEVATKLFGSDNKKILSCIRNVVNPNNSRKSYKGYKFIYKD